jgi:carbon-monoxide dehydrogenase medium subunit
VKPAAFDYRAPGTVAEALTLLAETGGSQTGDRRTGTSRTAVLAGGQSLVPLLNARRVRPEIVLDLNRLPGLDGITISGETVRVGAMTRLRDIVNDRAVQEKLPILPQTAALVAHPQIRGRSTIGGSLCHADPAAELPTLAVALDARLYLRSSRRDRVELAGRFFRAAHDTTRRDDELLVSVEFPVHPGMRFAFAEFPRHGQGGRPLIGLCAGIALVGGVVTAARLAAGGVANRPVRLAAAEELLVGMRPGDDLTPVTDAASQLAATSQRAASQLDAAPQRDETGYLRSLLGTLTGRTVAALIATAGQGADDEQS